MPSCLIELGFITDNQDNNLFDKNIKNYAKAIADGIIEEIKRRCICTAFFIIVMKIISNFQFS